MSTLTIAAIYMVLAFILGWIFGHADATRTYQRIMRDEE